MKKIITILVLIATLLSAAAGALPSWAATGDPVLINEVLASHSGTDDTEFIELFGTAGYPLSGLSLIVVEGDASGPGIIDRRFDFKPFHEIGPNGFFLFGNCGGLASDYGVTPDASLFTNYLENDSLTVALVETGSLSGGVGDTISGSEVVRDAVALTDGDAGDTFYFGAPVIGPDGSYFPAGARRLVDGVDTDTTADWAISSFSLPGDNTPTSGGFDGCTPIPLTIPEIQGDGQFSDYQGEVVETSGVVTLFTANGAHCWLQDPDGDDDAATSDGIFVSGCAYPGEGPTPIVGDLIRIVANVEEQQFGNALPLTRLLSVALIEVQSSGNPLPMPIELTDLPDESIVEGIDFWEPLEGMLVAVYNAPVVAPTSAYGEFAMLANDDAKPGSGFYPETQQLFVRNLGGDVVDYNPERILVDDSSLDAPIVVMPGDRVRSLVGVVDYTFGNYKLQPASFDIKTHDLPTLPASTRSGPNGDTVITTFNVENLFDLHMSGLVDVIGQVGFDPGSEWGSGLISTRDNTIRRQPSICQGDADETDAFDPSLEWEGFAQNTFGGLGAHTSDCAPAAGLFFSEYVEGSSTNKALEIYNGTGAAVDLAAGNYSILMSFNGGTSTYTIDLTGTVADGDVYVVAPTNATDPTIVAEADQLQGTSWFNGDDAVVLRKGGKDDASSTPTPEELEIKLTKLAMAIELELELPEVLVVQEVENTAILQQLGDRVNAAAGTDYVATSFETSDARGIEVGFLWDADRVTLLDAYQMSGPDVEAAFGPSSPSPGREPLVGVFEMEGQEITIIGNHFKSKSGDDALFGVNWPPIRVTEVQRKMQAQVVRDFVDTILDADPDALVMVTGDLNDFPFGEPGEGPDHPVAILEGFYGGVPLTNLLNLEKDDERFTYVYDGNTQVLEHMLVSPGLLDRFVAVDGLHFNASYPDVLSTDPSTTLQVSDHDPLEGRFRFK